MTKRYLDFDDPHVWDRWREDYDLFTDEDHRAFYDRIAERYPEQKHFSYPILKNYFTNFVPKNARVAEIGGWKGELASKLLADFPDLVGWYNFEFCQKAVADSVVKDERYRPVVPHIFRWFGCVDWSDFDVFVAAHTIEHLSDADLIHLLDKIKGIKRVVFEAPIGFGPSHWVRYPGTHILKMGWSAIYASMDARGYFGFSLNETIHCFNLKG